MSQAAESEKAVQDPMTAAERRQHYASLRAAYESVLKSQWASPQSLGAAQEQAAKRLVAHAIRQVPFYRDRLDVLRRGEDGVDLARWLEVPLLRRADLVAEAEAMKAATLPPEHGATHIVRSSGTTGGRVEVVKTELQDTVNACTQCRYWDACELDYSNNLGMVRVLDPNAPSTGPGNPELAKWGPPWLPFRERGDRRILSVHNPPARQLEWLAGLVPVYLHTMPSNLLSLAHHVRDHGGDLSGIAGAITGGEALTADVRKQVRRWLGLEMFDALASTECGLIATQCPDGGGYHIEAEGAVVEVLKEDGSPCRPGETGLLTVTPLYAYAMPLIRYQTDDWVTVGGMCSCGRTLPVIAEIVGREHQLLLFSDGSKLRLEPDSDVMFCHLGPRRWQIAQRAPDRIEVRVAELRVEQPADFEAAAAYVRELLGRDLEVECVFVPVLGPGPSGKFDRVVREFA